MKENKNYVSIIVIAVMLLLIVFMYALLIFDMTSRQTTETGKYQLESISGELESTINETKNLTMQLAIEAQTHLDNKEELAKFIYDSKEKLPQYVDGGYNIYVAGSGWDIIPDLVKPQGYDAVNRSWYTGAVKSGGKAYVTPPYSDAATGNICYSVSVMLGDGDTVLGIDYTMENIQAHVEKMIETGLHNAVIVTEDGIIAGGSDETLIGDTLTNRLPEYTAVFHLAKNNNEFVSYRITSGLFHENLFATKSGSGWYLIVSESDWELYRNSYIQLIVTILLMLVLMTVIIVLYVGSVRNRRKAEDALHSKNEFLAGITAELESPLRRIINDSDIKNYPDNEALDERLASIHTAGEQLSYAIRQIITYSGIVKLEKNEELSKKPYIEKTTLRVNKRFRNIILSLLIFVMAAALTATAFLSVGLANSKMENDVNSYERSLSEWIYKQKSILDMFASMISTDPDILNDYDTAIRYLDSIAKQYPEISVVYMTNPNFEHTVYMNNGWEPDDNWHVEERQWYIDTLSAKDGWSISAPYYDEQTGIYCVTISKRVYDDKTGEFLGNFGIDFYMDKLVEILGGSYSDSGYAFLADASGDIINHPYGTYQMSLDGSTNVSELSYGELVPDGSSSIIINDYDDTLRIITAKRSELSNFTIYKATGLWNIYGQSLIVAVLCLLAVSISIIIVYRLLTSLIRWQDNVNRKMQEAADAATAADAAKSRFLAQMSHEIRTPINAVLGMNEMIL
ncbi:MAG: histidine kinase, partial [Ruminococcus sp.]|nr:histidine kinase [Ruminococcus sp.]